MVENSLSQTAESNVTVVPVKFIGEQLRAFVEQGKITRGQNADQTDSLTPDARVVKGVATPVLEAGQEWVANRVSFCFTCQDKKNYEFFLQFTQKPNEFCLPSCL